MNKSLNRNNQPYFRLLLLTTFWWLISFVFPLIGTAQNQASTGQDRIQAYEQRKKLKEQSLVNAIEFRNVGPSVFSGRVVDVDVSPEDPSHFYVAYASGGLWKTENNGTTFTPIFDKEAVMTIGDISVDWERDIIWVGTGENNSSRSSYAGLGIYRSDDGGKTWQHRGLEESHHIGRIIQHPENPNLLWVAALGHLYTPNQERGIYKTTDGGTTWKQVLFVDDNSGAIDLLLDPNDPNTLFAATWHRERSAWNFVESGNGSGIYKSTDGGDNWQKVSGGNSGFPEGEGVGRIGLTAHPGNGNTILYAVLDNYFRRPAEDLEKEEEGLVKNDFKKMSKSEFLDLSEKELQSFLQKNRFPKKYSAKKVREMVEKDELQPIALAEYLEDANSLLFETPVVGAQVYRSDDGGMTWKKTHEQYLDDIYFTYGYYFGEIRVSPHDSNRLYLLGMPLMRSDDGGKNFKTINAGNVHADHHAMWVNPERKGHIILGNDGGINISYDAGENWMKCNMPPVGQFYAVAVDRKEPYNVYGGLQDNGVWMGPSTYEAGVDWQNSGHYPYKSIMGGDGMQVAIDTRDNETVYTGFQFGNYFRINTRTGDRKRITPKHELGERPLRWNWQSPIHLSVHNQDILYFGSNKLHRSMNQGDDFVEISGDLTTGGRKGDVAFSTLTTIHESPLRFGLIYVGTDDGKVHLTKNGGSDWQEITSGLPADKWVSRVWSSAHSESRVYVSLNGYRDDDFRPYLFVSDDYGATWKNIAADLPEEAINVIKEDAVNENLLYVGTDHGLYVSLNRGNSWMLMDNGLPAVAVHDVVVHPTQNDLVVGTHGRSIYIGNVAHLQQLTDELRQQQLYVFAPAAVTHSDRWGVAGVAWLEPSEPKMQVGIWSKQAGSGEFLVKNKEGYLLYQQNIDLKAGLNYLPYHLVMDEQKAKKWKEKLLKNEKNNNKANAIKPAKTDKKYYLPAGKYELEIKAGSNKQSAEWEVKKR